MKSAPPSALPRHAMIGVCACVMLYALPAAAAPTRSKAPPPSRTEVADKQSDLKELRAQIEALRKEMAVAESKRANAADELRDVERDISGAQRELHTLSGQQTRLQARIVELARQEQALTGRSGRLQTQLESQIYWQYVRGDTGALRMLLNGEDPHQLARDLYYFGAIGRARSATLQETVELLEQKKALAEDMRERAEELTAVEARQKEQHGKLLAQRQQRKDTLDRISSKIADQRKEIGTLQRDEKQLTQLIARLSRIIAAQPAPRKAPPPRTSTPSEKPEQRPHPTELSNDSTPEALPAGAFSALKGSLRLPVRGVVTNRFGTPRQEGSAWKGLFIRAPQGSDVKAVANGRIVFADWMRGFGNLLIVDHGGSYLSIYGYNDAMLKQVGDSVRGGDSIASAGNSGGNPESGLYFELRYQGQPVDPLKWVNLR